MWPRFLLLHLALRPYTAAVAPRCLVVRMRHQATALLNELCLKDSEA